MPDHIEIDEMVDKVLNAKIDQAIIGSEQGLGKDRDVFKEEWLKEEL